MNSIFADAGYWIALLNPKDQLHSKAQAVSSQLGPVRLVTSEMILSEVLNYFADKGSVLRQAAAALAEQIQSDPNSVVVPQTSIQFRNALRLYQQRQDKSWGVTDCASILIMQAEGINEALAHDINFKQAGFTALLRDD